MKKSLSMLLICVLAPVVFVTAAALTHIVLPQVAQAHKGASGVIKTRMETMKTMGANMKLISQMLRDEKPYNARTMEQAARAIAEHAGPALTKLFPKGSLDHPSEARAEIWQQWPAFETSSEALNQAAKRFLAELKASQDKIKKDINNPMARGSSRGSFGKIDVALLPPEDSDMKRLEAAFAAMGKTCKSCHEAFRLKKQ